LIKTTAKPVILVQLLLEFQTLDFYFNIF